MFLRLPCMLVLSFDLIVSATPFQPTADHTSELSATPNIIGPVTLSNASIPPLDASEENGLNIRCDGETYGYNPNIVDCEDAKEYLLPDTKTWTFGERHTDLPADILPLPYRVMGDRGLCYIQTVLVRDHKTAKATLSMLRRAATALVVQCATSVVSQGGIATNIGKEPPRSLTIQSSPTWLPDCMGKLIDSGGDNNLAVILGIYQVPVSCRGTFSSWDSCRDILYDMPAGKKPGVFGPRGDPAVTEELPYNIESCKGTSFPVSQFFMS